MHASQGMPSFILNCDDDIWFEYINEWIRYQIPVHHTDPTEHHRISALYNLRYKLYKTDKDKLLSLISLLVCSSLSLEDRSR